MVYSGKIRPVGNRVPLPDKSGKPALSWEGLYHTRFVDSGTSALSLAIRIARDLKPSVREPEVLLPGYGCPDIIAAAHAQGVTPVLVDLVPESPWMDTTLVSSKLSDNTVAIVAVNFLGLASPMEELSDLARRSGSLLIEDSAQRMPPSSAQTAKADLLVLSFGRGKPVNLMGGGALLVSHALEDQAQKSLSRFPVNSKRVTLKWALKRQIFNLLVSRICFGLLERIPLLRLGETRFKPLERITLERPIPGLLASGLSRFETAPDYRCELGKKLKVLDRHGWIRLPETQNHIDPSNTRLLRYSLLAPDAATRDYSVRSLNQAGVGANSFYGDVLPAIPGVIGSLRGAERLECAKDFASRLITLPVHEDVTSADIEGMVQVLLMSAQQKQ
ncbi:aminotransferase class V-fold PLP-dependent enzyme [Marinobacter sp. CHS3-4]|uniref:aminotransferase class V-fold PLP-dependent enzyme n=1 Tax=Marinobacter sp. CHS3-4 TaxID=3045174 RepID=UPI0024B49DF0|nr:aminotransferase class V-fold PLP-dependent enzyme [Marinobacter sp. CHS3-4]MDI9245582.1 aminotransferase class V-fold PLP-dependent enzyme [Marinobacter sp. CHS3-4]